jgi:hypothetical protein
MRAKTLARLRVRRQKVFLFGCYPVPDWIGTVSD